MPQPRSEGAPDSAGAPVGSARFALRGRMLADLALLDFLVDLGTMDRDLPRGFDPDADLVAVDRDHDDPNVVADDDGLIGFTR